MDINKRIEAFAALGSFLNLYTSNDKETHSFSKIMDENIELAMIHNPWFIKEDIFFNLRQWAQNLTTEKLTNWVKSYSFQENQLKTIAVIMAGNIPLVGFHDFLSVLISGNKVLVKQSSKDKFLLPCLAQFLIHENPEFKNLIEFTDERLENFDAVIATGSGNTARYFEYYFSKKPHIIRKNRSSVAILTGDETKEDLENLSEDIFRYFGLGCRNVSKLYVPENYNFTEFFEAVFPRGPIINHHKYANNYDYYKAVYLMGGQAFLENNFLIIKEDKSDASPIACVFYEYYTDLQSLKEELALKSDQIQCMVSESESIGNLRFGETQKPNLTDYADGVDTMEFLTKL